MRRLAIVALAATLLLCGCEGNGIKRSEDAKEKASATASGRFICDDSTANFGTVVDSHTGVTYLIWYGSNKRGGITVLLNRDGTPVISEVEK